MITLENVKHEIQEIMEKGCMSSQCIKDLTMLYYLEEKMEHGHAYMKEHHGKVMDRATAKEWVDSMEDGHGHHGMYYTIEQTNQVLKSRNWNCDPVEFWAIMNAVRSDYGKVAEQNGVDHMDFYADLAGAWLKDPDAKPGKAMNYYNYVVKHG
jgi:hypothetical protein